MVIDLLGDSLVQANIVFISLFAIEAALKIVSMTFRMYIKDRWNLLDFIIVVASVLDLILDYATISASVCLDRPLALYLALWHASLPPCMSAHSALAHLSLPCLSLHRRIDAAFVVSHLFATGPLSCSPPRKCSASFGSSESPSWPSTRRTRGS
jgi:hypothetical protein